LFEVFQSKLETPHSSHAATTQHAKSGWG